MNEGVMFSCNVTHDEVNLQKNCETLFFEQEGDKKSSFVLKVKKDGLCVEQPGHVMIQVMSQNRNEIVPFILGGFEFIGNSKNIEVYITDSSNKKETYLTTCRGVREVDNSFHFRIILVIPGGPKSMFRLRLKLLSVQPVGTNDSWIYGMTIKGRLPSSEKNIKPTQPILPAAFQPKSPVDFSTNKLSMLDMSEAITGVSMMVRSTEDRLCQIVQETGRKMEEMKLFQCQSIQQLNLVMQQRHDIVMNNLEEIQKTNQLLSIRISDLEAQNQLLLERQRQQERKQEQDMKSFVETFNKENPEENTEEKKVRVKEITYSEISIRATLLGGNEKEPYATDCTIKGNDDYNEENKPHSCRSRSDIKTQNGRGGNHFLANGHKDMVSKEAQFEPSAENESLTSVTVHNISLHEVKDNGEDDDDKPPSRSIQLEEEKKLDNGDKIIMLEPPDKGPCGDLQRQGIEDRIENAEEGNQECSQ